MSTFLKGLGLISLVELQVQGWKFAADGKCTNIPQALNAKANSQVLHFTLCLHAMHILDFVRAALRGGVCPL